MKVKGSLSLLCSRVPLEKVAMVTTYSTAGMRWVRLAERRAGPEVLYSVEGHSTSTHVLRRRASGEENGRLEYEGEKKEEEEEDGWVEYVKVCVGRRRGMEVEGVALMV